jgi:hypothetical protein
MKRAKQKRLSEQLFPISSPSIPIQNPAWSRQDYFASRGLDYHFREDKRRYFFGCNPAPDAICNAVSPLGFSSRIENRGEI